MYNPPTEDNWIQVGRFDDSYKSYYDLGYDEAKNEQEYEDPYEPSGHERDTTYTDELNFWYYCGYYDWVAPEFYGDFI